MSRAMSQPPHLSTHDPVRPRMPPRAKHTRLHAQRHTLPHTIRPRQTLRSTIRKCSKTSIANKERMHRKSEDRFHVHKIGLASRKSVSQCMRGSGSAERSALVQVKV
eukprot:3343958-Pleurochrysis_carterae.AAC.5